ncbi:MAG: SseB family protein [Ruminococcus sp.]|nr:SseB family protein [Ruminococcus sp.]
MAENNNGGRTQSIKLQGGEKIKEQVKNPELIQAINEMRANFNSDNQNKVINLVLRSTFLIPAKIEKTQELVADQSNHVEFQDKNTAKFLLVNHKERGAFFPVFTDITELEKMKSEEPSMPFAMKFADLAGLTENTPDVVGFVINPFHENLPFTKEMLQSIKQTLIEYRKKKEAEQAGAPGITLNEKKDQ